VEEIGGIMREPPLSRTPRYTYLRTSMSSSRACRSRRGMHICLEWDADASTSDGDDEKTPSKSFAGIAINKKPSIFDTPTCFMAKGPKVQYNESDGSEIEDAEPSKEELIVILLEGHAPI